VSARATTALWAASMAPAWSRFRRALREPGQAQQQVLARILQEARGSAFSREHSLDDVRSLEAFQGAVPARSWAELSPWVDRAAKGEPDVLTTSPLTRFEPTSGTTTGRKLVPSTRLGRWELRQAVGAWLFELYRRDPGLLGPSYWSISPSLPEQRTEGGHPIGFDDDAGYLGGLSQHLVRRALVSPPRGLQGEAFWRAVALAVLGCRELRILSVWNPSFGLLLCDAVRQHWDEALRVLPRPRAQELQRAGPEGAWPRLRLLSAWADAQAAAGLPALRARFPGVEFQPKGLLATEGIVSLPFQGAHPMAVTSHFLELERDDGAIVPLWTARPGEEGLVLLTTGAGLWRYRLGDRIAVTGLLRQTPTVRFLGRQGVVSDLHGEKLTEPFVAEVLARLGVTGFAMLAPEDGGYVLYAERPPLAERLEQALSENPHYRWCVSLGQLRPVVVRRVGEDAGVRYVRAKAAGGMREGDVKAAVLEKTGGWGGVLG
jgi:hypothetical protein